MKLPVHLGSVCGCKFLSLEVGLELCDKPPFNSRVLSTLTGGFGCATFVEAFPVSIVMTVIVCFCRRLCGLEAECE